MHREEGEKDISMLLVQIDKFCEIGREVPWKSRNSQAAWVAQSVKLPTSAQVTISRFMGSSPTWGSVLTARSLEPVLDSVSLCLCSSPLVLSFSQK